MRAVILALALLCLGACGDSPTTAMPANGPGCWGDTEGREGLTAVPPGLAEVIEEPTIRQRALSARVDQSDEPQALPGPTASQQHTR